MHGYSLYCVLPILNIAILFVISPELAKSVGPSQVFETHLLPRKGFRNRCQKTQLQVSILHLTNCVALGNLNN